MNSPIAGLSAGTYFTGTTDPAIFGNTLTAGIVGAPTMLTGAMPRSFTDTVLKNWLMGPQESIVAGGPAAEGSAPEKPAGFWPSLPSIPWGTIVIAILGVGVVWVGVKAIAGGGK